VARETWSSRTAFILAAIGSAIGLGNIWRFPYVAYENGGGVFLFAYFVCLFVAGIPLLMLEFSLGHRAQRAAPGAFGLIHPKMKWFGWFAAGVGFVIVCYYAIVMSWCANYAYQAPTLGWQKEPGRQAIEMYAVADTELKNMEVQKDVPPELLDRTFFSTVAMKGAQQKLDGESTVMARHKGHVYAFASKEEADKFLKEPFEDVDVSLGTVEEQDTALVAAPVAVEGETFISPLAKKEAGQKVTADTILIAFQGKLYGFGTAADATTFMGDPGEYFIKDLLGLSKPWDFSKFKTPLLLGLLFSWIAIILCVWKGTKTVSKVVYFTVLIPWALLVVFIVRGVTLKCAGVGLEYYLVPAWGKLADPKLWLAAISQVFYSLSVGFAIMIAYGSFLPKKTNIAMNAIIIGVADSVTAFCGGLAVFSALGHQADKLGV
jgi:SNF family Na+-dependent transporter